MLACNSCGIICRLLDCCTWENNHLIKQPLFYCPVNINRLESSLIEFVPIALFCSDTLRHIVMTTTSVVSTCSSHQASNMFLNLLLSPVSDLDSNRVKVYYRSLCFLKASSQAMWLSIVNKYRHVSGSSAERTFVSAPQVIWTVADRFGPFQHF